MTYGDRPAADHQARFEALALSKFERAPHRWSVPDERRYTSPKAVRVSYAAEAGAAEGNTHIVWGWLLGHTIDVDASLDAHLLAGALLDNSSSPLRHYLESSGLASAPSELCGLEDSTRELVMCCGVEDAKTNAETALERGVLGVLERVASDGVPQDVIAGLIDRMEMSQRDIGGNHYPYGLQLMNRLLRPALHGANPCDFLDIDPALVRLRDRAGADTHVPNLIRRHLLDNPHRVRVTMAPDKALADRQRAEEEANLRRLLANADCERLNAIRARARALKERQSRADDSNVLPRLTLADVPADIPVVIGADRRFGGIQGRCYARGTNGIVYQQVVVPLPAFPPEQLMWLPYFVDYLTDVGFGPHDYLQAERDRAAIGAFNAQVSLRAAIFDAGWLRGYLAIGGKALLRKHGLLFDRLHAMYAQARFDEHARLRELIAQSRAEMEATITDRGHMLAMHAAAARLSPAGWLDDQWDGPSAIAALKSLDDAADSGGVEDFAARLAGIAALLRNAEPRLLLVAEEAELRELEASLERVWESAQAYATPPHRLEVPPVAERADTAYTTNTRVNFCACAYRTVPEQHADAPVLMVLGRYLQNGFLHQAIRERGGAYGSGAGYSADGAIFQYYSYRDPRFTGTFDDFAASLGWLIKTRDARQLEEAILGVIRALDQPKSPAGEAIAAYYNELHGRDVDFRRHLRRAVLAVGYDDLLRVAGQYLIGATPARAVVTSADEAAEAERAGFRVAEL
jgi:Zn-dependent M16 (insulinase) family peptidase